MLLREIDYVKPNSLQDALSVLAERRDAKCLAGGQTLVNVMKHRIASPGVVVDLNGLPELRGVVVQDERVTVGAMARYVEIAEHPELGRQLPIVAYVANHIADRQVRNRGTIGGNCCFNDPTSNFPPLLSVLNAEFDIVGLSGSRVVGANEFFVSPYRTAVQAGELLRGIHIPLQSGVWGASYLSLRVGNDGPALLHAAAYVSLQGDNVGECRVALGGVEGAPYRLLELEAALQGGPASESELVAVCQTHFPVIEGLEDVHASSVYRAEMARVFARRALVEAIKDARGRAL